MTTDQRNSTLTELNKLLEDLKKRRGKTTPAEPELTALGRPKLEISPDWEPIGELLPVEKLAGPQDIDARTRDMLDRMMREQNVQDITLTPNLAQPYGVKFEEGLKLRGYREGERVRFSVIDAGGYEYRDDETIYSPAGEDVTETFAKPAETEQQALMAKVEADLNRSMWEVTTLPNLPDYLQQQYNANRRAQELDAEFDKGNFIPEMVDEYNNLKGVTSDEDFIGLLDEWQVSERERLAGLVETVLPDVYAVIPIEDKAAGVENYVHQLATDEAQQNYVFDQIYQAGRNADTEGLLKMLMPEITERDIRIIYGENVLPLNELPLGSYKLTKQPFQDVFDFAQKEPQNFRLSIRYEGHTPETEALLKQIYGEEWATKKNLKLYFEETTADKFVRGEWLPQTLQDWVWDPAMTGVGDILSISGGIADRFGADATAEELKLAGAYSQVYGKDIEWGEKYSAAWFAKSMARMAPMMLGLMGISVATGGVASGAIASAGGSAFLQAAGGAVASGLTASVGEGMMEAGDAYNEAKRRGMTDEEANAVFDKVMTQNVAGLSASNIAQYGLTFFVPGGKTAGFMVKALTYGFDVASEGLEEVGQLAIQRGALGDPQAFDDEMLQNFVLGAGAGFGFAAVGSVHTLIQDKITEKMNPSQYDTLRQNIQQYMGQGLSRKEAETKAWDEFAGTPEGEAMIQETVREVQAEEQTEIPQEQVQAAVDEITKAVSPASEKVDALVREITGVPETKGAPTAKTGEDIAKQLGVKYDGVQEGLGMQFTDPKTGSTFYGNTVQKAKTNLVNMQKKFGITPSVSVADTVYSEEIKQAFEDWNSGRAYIDNAGNYRIKSEGRQSGPIASWNKEVKKAFVNVTEFSNASQSVPAAPEKATEVIKPAKVETITPAVPEGVTPIPQEAEIPPAQPPTKPPAIEIPAPIPPPPSNAARTVYNRIEFDPEGTGFIDKIRRGWHKFNVKMVDDLFAIKKIVDQSTKSGIELSIEENPYLLARLLRGITGKANVFLEQGTFGKKFWKMEKGKATPNFTGESLENILKEVRQPEVWRDFSTYLTARRAFDLSLRDITTGISQEEAAAAIAELEEKYTNFRDFAERVYKYQDNLMVYANEMGLVSDDLLGKLRKYADYVPFYRVFNELQAKGLMGKKMANIAQPVKRIKGSEREIINPLESIVKNTYVIINSAEHNQVGVMIANLVNKNPNLAEVFERVKTPIARVAGVTAKELGVEIEGMTDTEAESVVDIFRPSFYTRSDEVTVLINGKKQFYKVDQDLRDALLNLDRESLGTLGKIFGAPARWLRAGATLSPDFMVRNPARDQLTAFAYSNYGFLPGVDFIRGLASVIAKDADYQLYRASGAEHSMLVSMDREYLSKTFKEIVEGRKFTFYVKHPMELLRIASELGEKSTRLGEFKAGIRRGAMPLEAGYSSRVVSLDFAQSGTTAHAVNNLIAFFNANLRGWGRMMSSFKEHPIRTSFKVFAGITLPSILLYMVNRDDDRWKEIPQWQKDLFWIVMTEDNIYRIPKPFELGIIFGSIPERFMEWLDTKDPDLFKESMTNLVEAGSPGIIPTAGLPVLEWMTNYSFFKGYSLVPASCEKMPPELQYTRYTSEVSKKLGELLKLPPVKIDNTINGYTAGLGRYAVDILDGILKKTGISSDIPEPSPTLADTPVIKAFVVRNPYGSSGKTVEDFYDKLEEYQKGEQYLKEMMDLGEQEKFDKYRAEHPELLFFYQLSDDPEKEGVFYSASARYLRRVSRDISELSGKQDEVYKSKDISPEEKRRLIDEIDILKTDVTRKALNLFTDEVPQVLQDRVRNEVNRLGEIIEDTPVLSLEKPDIYDTRKLYTFLNTELEAATMEDISTLKGIDPLAAAFIEVKEIKKNVDSIPNKKIYEIKPKLKEGVTFGDYIQSWQQGIFENEELSQISRRQLDLLRQYSKLDKPGQKQFLTDNPELSFNPRQDWLLNHPKENAQLAIWGKADILTKEAYNEFNRLIKELDIPDGGIPLLTLPPATSIDTHFTYEQMVNDGVHGNWEASLLLKKDAEQAKKDGVKSYAEWKGLTLSDTPIASLELKTESTYRGIYNQIKDFSDKDSLDYKDDKIKDAKGLTERDRAVAGLRATKIGDMNYLDIDRKIAALEKGNDETPVNDALVNAHIEYMRMQDAEGVGSSTAEVMLFRVDNPEYNTWRLDTDVWGNDAFTKDIDQARIPIWRIDAQYRRQDAEYDAIKSPDPAEQTSLRNEYLANNAEYRLDRRRRDALTSTGPKGETFATDQIEQYVQYNELPDKGKRRDRFLIDNPEFATAIHTINGMDLPSKVPSVQYDDIYDQYQSDFDRIEGLADNKSPDYIEDVKQRDRAREEMRFDKKGKLTEFGKAEIRRNAYGLYVPDDYVERYVDYYTIAAESIPDDWPTDKKGEKLTWYSDDWYLIEHPAFYENIYIGQFELEKIDFSKVPGREVFKQYAEYVNLPEGKRRDDYRWTHRDLDKWLLLTKKVTTSIEEKRRRASLTPKERALEELQGIEERLRER